MCYPHFNGLCAFIIVSFISVMLPTGDACQLSGQLASTSLAENWVRDQISNESTFAEHLNQNKWKIRWQFMSAYYKARASQQSVFAKYLDILGAGEILDFLEAVHPSCHSQAHELGAAIFAQLKDVNLALRVCDTRCTSGCMHGIMQAAFRGATIEDVTRQMGNFCSGGEMSRTHKPGNCAHGIGHSLMGLSGHDVEASLNACSAFAEPAMAYYCATGVFMEDQVTEKTAERNASARLLASTNPHFPCDVHNQFPAACYRYHVARMIQFFRGDRSKVVQACLALPRSSQLGCLHGYGTAHIGAIAYNPNVIAKICSHGTSEGQAMCIEGAIEKLADFSEEKAKAACDALDGENAVVCDAAAQEKMYRLHKPTMPLYYGQSAHIRKTVHSSRKQ